MKKLVLYLFTILLLSSFAFAATNDADYAYSLDDADRTGDTITDISGNGNTAYNRGGTLGTTADWILNEAIDFERDNQEYITVGAHSHTGDLTICAWIQTETGTIGTQRIVSNYDSDGNDVQYDFRLASGTLNYGSGASSVDSGYSILDGLVYFVCSVKQDGKVQLYVNNTAQGSNTSVTPSAGSVGNMSIGRPGDFSGSGYFDGIIEMVYVYERGLNDEERTELWNGGVVYNTYAAVAAADILTVTAQNVYDNSTINDFNVTLPYNATVFTTNNGTVTINITEAGGNVSELQNATVIGNYSWPVTYTGRNLSETLLANLTESEIRFDLFQMITNDSLSGHIYDNYSNQTNGTPFYFSFGEHTVLVNNVAGHYDLNFTINVTRQQNNTVNLTGIYSNILRLNALATQNQALNLTSFNVTVNSTGEKYQTANYYLNIPTLNETNDTYLFEADGYFPVNYSIFVNESLQLETRNMTILGGVLLNFYDANTSQLVNETVFLTLENLTNSFNYTVNNGIQLVDVFVLGEAFTLNFYAAGYSTSSYFLLYEGQDTLDLYMQNGTDTVSYVVKGTNGDAIQNALISIERFVDGVWEEVNSGLTDVTGQAQFELNRGITHRITFTADGFLTKVDITRLASTEYTIFLEPLTQVDYDQGTQHIFIDYSPKTTTVNATTNNFWVNISSSSGNLEYVFMNISLNDTLLFSDVVASNSGAYMNYTTDLTAYNGSLLIMEYGFQVVNQSEPNQYSIVYIITTVYNYDGSLLELKDRLSQTLTQAQAIGLYAVVFFIILIIASIFMSGLPALFIALVIASICAWLFGVNLILLIVVIISVLALAASVGQGGGGL